MSSKRGLWVVLGASALVMGVATVGCGSSSSGDQTPPAETTGTGGAFGSSGSGGSATAGKAGSSTGGSAGGKAGAATGGSTAGGTGGSTGGSTAGGAGGSTAGGSGGGATAATVIGSICEQDSDCGAGFTCLMPMGTDFFGEGAANGYCSMDCTAFVTAVKADPNTMMPDPCDPNQTGAAFCLNFAKSSTDPDLGRCVQACNWGQPAIDNNTKIGQLSADKCQGRPDMFCFPLEKDPSANPPDNTLEGAFCRPFCQQDSQCPTGYKCDASLGGGGCVPAANLPAQLLPSESACDPTSMTRQCESDCFTLFSMDDAATPTIDESKLGMCWDSCEEMAKESCQGHNGDGTAYCGLYPYTVPTVNGMDVQPGVQDIALCSNLFGLTGDTAAVTDDNHCLWEGHMFMQNFGTASMPVGACIFQPDCTTDNDCVFDCKADADCGNSGETCVNMKCQNMDGTPANLNRKCVTVPELGAGFCIDHTPPKLTLHANLPPGVVINGSGGAGGSGTGGSAGSSAGGSAGTAGSTTGGAGGVAGSGGAGG